MDNRLKKKDEENLSEIHSASLEITRLAHLSVKEGRKSREWLLRISHAHERIGLMLERLNR